jgi:hypothetical protein
VTWFARKGAWLSKGAAGHSWAYTSGPSSSGLPDGYAGAGAPSDPERSGRSHIAMAECGNSNAAADSKEYIKET